MNNIVSFHEYLLNKGYFFDQEIIENYLLSLKVKPFVIFTGNSGTGKTKLSQLFAEYIANYYNTNEKLSFSTGEEYLTVKVKSNESSWKHGGWTLSTSDFHEMLPIKEVECDFNMFVDDIHAKGYIRVYVQLFYENNDLKTYFKKLYDLDKNQLIDLKINLNVFKELLDDCVDMDEFIIINQKANKSAFNERQWFMNKDIFDYLPFKQGFVPCEIMVGDIKSNAKFRLMPKLFFKKNKKLQDYLKDNNGHEVSVKIEANKFNFDEFKPIWGVDNDFNVDCQKEPKYKIVPVGANWTENRHVLGFYNVITGEYNETSSYVLIKEAEIDKDNPYFLILDEMNLSHVERYFSDFLSAIESKQSIPLYFTDEKSYELSIPDNLLIVGTVNVDETTYMFSPKVLDRANTIEFPTMSASEYMSFTFDGYNFKDTDYLINPLDDLNIRSMGINELKDVLYVVSCSEGNLWDVLSRELDVFQTILKKIRFDFGFRVINEILRFMVVSWKYEGSPDHWDNWERYFDAQIKQKILPKLHGSQKVIGQSINDLFNVCLKERGNNNDVKLINLTDDDCRYYTSAIKLQNMAKILSDQRYVSFIN